MVDLYLKAKPVFIDETGPNIQAGFIKELCIDKIDVRVIVSAVASTFFRLYVNGKIAAHGPARTCIGYMRVDEIDVTDFVTEGKNIFAFEVSYYGLPFGPYSNEVSPADPMFACVIESVSDAGSKILAATDETWKAIRLSQRVQYTERISHCRASTEVYNLDEIYFTWRTDASLCTAPVKVVEWQGKLLKRGMDLPSLAEYSGYRLVDMGEAFIDKDAPAEEFWYEKYEHDVPGVRREFLKTKEASAPSNIRFERPWAQKVRASGVLPAQSVFFSFDFLKSSLGFIGIDIETSVPGTVDICHFESLGLYHENSVISSGANAVTRLHVSAGRIRFTSFEPALMRYLKIYFRPDEGTEDAYYFTVNKLCVLDYSAPDTYAGSFQCSDDNINRLYEAARRTLKLNTLDIFMDCPERERGGWLCDSLWTARAWFQMMGDTNVERSFIENYLLTPLTMWKGFFPDDYPCTRPNMTECMNITTWSFWLMEELCEYVRRSKDYALAFDHKDRVVKLVEGSMTLLGESGLFENLPCNFIDWSFSNDGAFNNPISTGANALYAKMLIDLGELYGEKDWTEKGRKIRSILRKALAGSDEKPADREDAFSDGLSYDAGTGKFTPNGRATETVQYLLYWTETFTREELPKNAWYVIHTMGTAPDFPGVPNVGGAQLFIGLCIRMDLMAKFGEYDVLMKDMKSIFEPQLKEGPGTLWENRFFTTTSRCHGFTSHAGFQLTRDILGIGIPDEVTKTVKIAPHPGDLRWARGTVLTSDGYITLSWINKPGEFEINLTLPEGWKVSE